MANVQLTADQAPLVTYPRAFVTLGIRLNGSSQGIGQGDVVTGLVPDSVELNLGPHHQAQTAQVTVRMSAMPFDPRAIVAVMISVYLGDAKGNGDVATAIRKIKYLRFVGYADSLDQEFSDKDETVQFKCRDLSAILRDIKPLPVKATPKYSDTVQQSISRILDTCGLPAADAIDLDDGGAGLLTRTLAAVVGKRAQTGYVPLKREVNAWEAIEHACGLVNVLVSVDVGKVLLRKPTDAFGNDKGIISGGSATSGPTDGAYTFIFGDDQSNTLRVKYMKKFLRNRTGVRATAFDPVTRRMIYADYPPDSQVPPKKRPNLASTKKHKTTKTTTAPAAPPRDVYAIGDGVHTKDALQAIAERIYRERARQEMEGSLVTPVWDDALFDLRNGSRVNVKVKPRLEAEVRNTKDAEKAAQFLQDSMAIDKETARALVNAIRNKDSTLFYARTLKHRWTSDRAETTVDFINLVDI